MDVARTPVQWWQTSILALALVLLAVAAERRGSVPFPWIDLLTGCALLLAGLLTASQAGLHLSGLLLLAAGTTWFVSTADLAGTLTDEVTFLHRGLVVHAVLAVAVTRRTLLPAVAVVALGYVASIDPSRPFSTPWQIAVAAGTIALLFDASQTRPNSWRFGLLAGIGVATWTSAVVWLRPRDLLEPQQRSIVYGVGLAMAASAVAAHRRLARHASPVVTDIVRDSGTGEVRIGFRNSDDCPFLDVTGAPVEAGQPGTLVVRSASGVDMVIAHPGAATATGRVRDTTLEAASQLLTYREALAAERTNASEIIESEQRIRAADQIAAADLALDLEQSVLGPLARATDILNGDTTTTGVEATAALRAIVEDLRTVTAGLVPAELSDGLGPAVRALAERSGLQVSSTIDPAPLGADIAAALYFVAAEAITNAVRHGHANAIDLALTSTTRTVEFTIADDGLGGAAEGERGGLRGLRERLTEFGGTLSVTERPGGGTVVTARLPVAARVSPPW